MLQQILDTMFGCSHRRTTFPLTPTRKSGAARHNTYVTCLDCGKELSYNWDEMRVGEPVAAAVPVTRVQPSFR